MKGALITVIESRQKTKPNTRVLHDQDGVLERPIGHAAPVAH